MNNRICSIPDCGRGHYAKGFCNRHWQQSRSGTAPSASRDQLKLRSPIPCRVCRTEHDGSSGLMAFCSRKHYYRWNRAGGDIRVTRECIRCGVEFSLLDPGTGGTRASRLDAERCVECRTPGHVWCMTVAEIAERDGGWRCAIGGEEIDRTAKWPDPKSATVDHIVPRSTGGQDVPDNVQLACWHHNRSKWDKTTYDVIEGRAQDLEMEPFS